MAAEALLAESEVIRKRACVPWCSIWVNEQRVAESMSPGLKAAGYSPSTDLYMALKRTPEETADVTVEQVTFKDIRPSIEAGWRQTGSSAESARALAGRVTTYQGVCELSFFAVREGDSYPSRCEVYRRGSTAQIDSVITDPPWQRRGYASAVVLAACGYLRKTGCDLVFLCTDAGDWPQKLYQRLGFSDIGTTYGFE